MDVENIYVWPPQLFKYSLQYVVNYEFQCYLPSATVVNKWKYLSEPLAIRMTTNSNKDSNIIGIVYCPLN